VAPFLLLGQRWRADLSEAAVAVLVSGGRCPGRGPELDRWGVARFSTATWRVTASWKVNR